MKPRLFAFFLLISMCLTYPSGAFAADTGSGSRYVMNTDSAVWRGAMGVRHAFAGGFSADLNGFQLRVAKLAGLKPEPVGTFNILSNETPVVVSPTPQMTPSQSVSWGVRMLLDDMEMQSTSGGAGVRIAVLDTGVDRTHPDLARRVVGCFDMTDMVRGLVEGQCEDLNGHGTHMAGILAADGGVDGVGSFGFAPQASVSAYKVCATGGTCFADDIAAAIVHASDNGANIIVLGMGGEVSSSLLTDAIAYAAEKEVLVVAGAGNDGPYEDSMDWPARDARVISVAAIDNASEPAEFSSRGLNVSDEPMHVDGDMELAAPGVNIESTFLGGGYAILSGTSMAAPHVAGLAAVLWQFDSETPAQATREQLRLIAEDIAETGEDAATGWGVPVLLQ